jgi:hypothetical protein|tara:strand:- start:196 stop:369 length:174 start_codon:yes stop_codon:yes gene_type:complete
LASLKLSIKTSTANTVDAEVDANVENLLAEANYIINNADEFLTEGGALVSETEAAVA